MVKPGHAYGKCSVQIERIFSYTKETWSSSRFFICCLSKELKSRCRISLIQKPTNQIFNNSKLLPAVTSRFFICWNLSASHIQGNARFKLNHLSRWIQPPKNKTIRGNGYRQKHPKTKSENHSSRWYMWINGTVCNDGYWIWNSLNIQMKVLEPKWKQEQRRSLQNTANKYAKRWHTLARGYPIVAFPRRHFVSHGFGIPMCLPRRWAPKSSIPPLLHQPHWHCHPMWCKWKGKWATWHGYVLILSKMWFVFAFDTIFLNMNGALKRLISQFVIDLKYMNHKKYESIIAIVAVSKIINSHVTVPNTIGFIQFVQFYSHLQFACLSCSVAKPNAWRKPCEHDHPPNHNHQLFLKKQSKRGN